MATIEKAAAEFKVAMVNSQNLVAIHKALKKGSGRRTKEMSLNRAIVVLTVASWQAFIEDLTLECVEALKPPAGQPTGPWQIMRGATLSAVGRYSTPNAENTKDLLNSVGLDPWPVWKWTFGPQRMSSADCRERMNQWLKVRHAIAHGGELPSYTFLGELKNGDRSLRRHEAEACMTFFERVVEVTNAHAVSEFAQV